MPMPWSTTLHANAVRMTHAAKPVPQLAPGAYDRLAAYGRSVAGARP